MRRIHLSLGHTLCVLLHHYKKSKGTINLSLMTNEQIIELEATLDKANAFYPQVRLVWMAMQDWPIALDDTDELLDRLKAEVLQGLTKYNLENYSAILVENLGLSGNGWKAESIASLVALFDYYPEVQTIDEIIPLFCRTALKKIN